MRNTEPPVLHYNRFLFNIGNSYCFRSRTSDRDAADSLRVSGRVHNHERGMGRSVSVSCDV